MYIVCSAPTFPNVINCWLITSKYIYQVRYTGGNTWAMPHPWKTGECVWAGSPGMPTGLHQTKPGRNKPEHMVGIVRHSCLTCGKHTPVNKLFFMFNLISNCNPILAAIRIFRVNVLVWKKIKLFLPVKKKPHAGCKSLCIYYLNSQHRAWTVYTQYM